MSHQKSSMKKIGALVERARNFYVFQGCKANLLGFWELFRKTAQYFHAAPLHFQRIQSL